MFHRFLPPYFEFEKLCVKAQFGDYSLDAVEIYPPPPLGVMRTIVDQGRRS